MGVASQTLEGQIPLAPAYFDHAIPDPIWSRPIIGERFNAAFTVPNGTKELRSDFRSFSLAASQTTLPLQTEEFA